MARDAKLVRKSFSMAVKFQCTLRLNLPLRRDTVSRWHFLRLGTPNGAGKRVTPGLCASDGTGQAGHRQTAVFLERSRDALGPHPTVWPRRNRPTRGRNHPRPFGVAWYLDCGAECARVRASWIIDEAMTGLAFESYWTYAQALAKHHIWTLDEHKACIWRLIVTVLRFVRKSSLAM